MDRKQQQKILDVLGDLLSRQYGCEVTLTLKPKEGEKDVSGRGKKDAEAM